MRLYSDKKGFYYHQGIDIGALLNTKIYAIANGEVIYIGRNYFIEDNLTVIDHGANIIAFYMHQSKILIKNGQKVKTGRSDWLSWFNRTKYWTASSFRCEGQQSNC